ncbi:MAG TPA: deoxyguanosinetriphosphate triphosphohydrolase, partial [Dermatophilaceae bacterium]|nr:deoxyguanosinetriphosphate triphosphohydrolase [Dermatophilaceae bacterium]
ERATRERHGPGPLVRHTAHLVVPDGTRAECAVLKGVAAHFVMNAGERAPLMARQREVVHGLVDAYLQDPDRLDRDLRADLDAAPDDSAALRVVVDQVASLTDVRALVLHGRWC